MDTKQLIRCPKCEYEDGQIQTLAEILPNGLILIRRARKIYTREQETTLLLGNNFELLCGRCQTIVFRKIPILIQQTQITFGTL